MKGRPRRRRSQAFPAPWRWHEGVCDESCSSVCAGLVLMTVVVAAQATPNVAGTWVIDPDKTVLNRWWVAAAWARSTRPKT